MQNSIDRPRDVDKIRDVMLNELKARIAKEMFNVPQISGDEIVHRYDHMPAGDKIITQMTSDEAGPAGNKHSHRERPMPWYSNPSAFIRSGSNRFRPSRITGWFSARLRRLKSSV